MRAELQPKPEGQLHTPTELIKNKPCDPAQPDSRGMVKTTPPARKPLRRRGAARVISESTSSPALGTPVVEHPDGWYWQAPTGEAQFGPFPSRAAALAAASAGDDDAPAEGESLLEAESELGIADWIDPDTGDPAPSGRLPSHDDR